MFPSHFINWGTARTYCRYITILGEIMKKFICILGGVLVLLFLFTLPLAAQSSGQRIVPTSEQKAAKKKAKGKTRVAIKKTQPAKAVAAKAKRTRPVMKVWSWYYNPLAWMAVGFALLIGGVIGRFLGFGPIPRLEEEVSEPEAS